MNDSLRQPRGYKYLVQISGVFGAVLIISNVLSSKIVSVFGVVFPGGAILFPIAYIIGDVLTEVYGYSSARQVIWAGFFGSFLWAISYWCVASLPAAPFWQNQESFETILGIGPRLAFAGMIAYLVGEFVNSYVLAKMKVYWAGRYLPARLVLSTMMGQALDTTIVLCLAFGGIFEPAQLFQMAISLWSIKVVWEIVALPFTIPIIRWIKRNEEMDFYDTNTDFNPFTFSKPGSS